MTTITRRLPVPLSELYKPGSDPTELLRQAVMSTINDFIEITDFRVNDGPPQISQSSAAVIYEVTYTKTENQPEIGKVYTGTVKSVVNGGATIAVPFDVFVQLTRQLQIGDCVSLVLRGIRKGPKGLLCVGILEE